MSELWETGSSLFWIVVAALTTVVGCVLHRKGARSAGALLAFGGAASFCSSAYWLAYYLDHSFGWFGLGYPTRSELTFMVVSGLANVGGLLQLCGLLLLAAAFCGYARRVREFESVHFR